jgi:lipopolysaccharide/colanic/teichoic acid biosynthesis glycosyltransferase
VRQAEIRSAREVARLRRRGWGYPATELCNRLVASALLVLLSPLVFVLGLAILLDSAGPAFYRCRRVGVCGREFDMLKFRKMHRSAEGLALTSADDERFTRLGRWLAESKLDELPQLWNVIRGDMRLVGPRPEDAAFVRTHATAYDLVLSVKPGITGLSQLAFARESQILDSDDPLTDYVERLLPLKIELDRLYAQTHSLRLDLRILVWTVVAVGLQRDVAVNRRTARISIRRRPAAVGPAKVETVER